MVRKGIFSSQSVSGSAFMAVDRSLARLLSPAADNRKSQSRNAAFPAINLAVLPNLEKGKSRGLWRFKLCPSAANWPGERRHVATGNGSSSRPYRVRGRRKKFNGCARTMTFAEERHLDRYVHDDYTKYLGARDVSEATNALKTKRLTFLEKMVPIRRCPPSRRIPPRNWKDGALWAQPWDRARGAE